MSKGLEMMVNMLFKTANVDPVEVTKKFKEAQELLVTSVNNFDTRLAAIEKEQQKQNELLSQILNKLNEVNNG